ncbi:N-terminal nucleophile aminohydrolase [Aspergillus steynii IBT 23096]|uniref:N-terminal nucleophile aminohydrolase n=1 Tax=Aspergillus steynii IBT 23096 TaxID=1392250 RepID=A0A2I2GRR9_9EURO|nr:N-terminal nucleophile aminohydrolase [Aspergillus steynii IBT 23096]PLB55568.1 N-terminal nucleophile aminohydrolase [Aspergillus steynii IBT 23096]
MFYGDWIVQPLHPIHSNHHQLSSICQNEIQPTLIIHGGAGALSRSAIPPHLYDQYHASLLAYLRSTRQLLESGSSALDAAVHAVSLLEDDELFNCARGSVFTSAGTIEMEASVMVTSMNTAVPDPDFPEKYSCPEPYSTAIRHDPGQPGNPSNIHPGTIKRGVGVIGLKNVRHPIQLAREVLLRNGLDKDADGDGGSMHAQLSAPYVEDLARQWGLEFEPDEYFWTQRRWDEHIRKLAQTADHHPPPPYPGPGPDPDLDLDLNSLPQGTVGCVCLDQYGNLAVATSTGGMTNKLPGRVGDTPTLGAGFWAESFGRTAMMRPAPPPLSYYLSASSSSSSLAKDDARKRRNMADIPRPQESPIYKYNNLDIYPMRKPKPERPHPPVDDEKEPETDSCDSLYRPVETSPLCYLETKALAVSGTGNGDSFLRTCAARTACAMTRFAREMPLSKAVTAVAGPGGELQQSAGDRWGSGEGEGGLIGIEVDDYQMTPFMADWEVSGIVIRGRVVCDFNCGGMWRAWMEDGNPGEGEEDREVVMVFKESYY